MDRPKVWAKDVAGQCVVQTRNDQAKDVRAALETAGLLVNGEMPIDMRSNVYQFIVAMPDGGPVTPSNVKALLQANDDVDVVED